MKSGRSRRPTRQAYTIATMGLLLMLAGSTAQAGWLFVLAAGVFGLAGGSMLAGHRLTSLEVSRPLPGRTRVGDPVRAGISVVNSSDRPTPLASIEDDFPAFEPVRVAVERIPPRGRAEIELVRVAERRGIFPGGWMTVTSAAPFGLVRSRRRVEVSSELIVVPRWVDLRSFPLLEPSSSPSDVLHERARTGAGEEFLGVREYRPGDPQRTVHWRSTARAGRLVVREYEEMTLSRVAIVVCGPDVGEAPHSAFESLVSAAASIGIYSLSTGHPIDLFGEEDGEVVRLPDANTTSLLDRLAGTSPSDDVDAAVTAAVNRTGRRGTVVLCAAAGAGGVPPARIGEALTKVQLQGARAIGVLAAAEDWTGHAWTLPTDLRAGRAPVRWLRRDKEIARCLEG